MFTTSEDPNMQKYSSINHSIPPISEDNLRLWIQNAPKFSSISMEDDHHHHHLSNGFQSEKSNSGEKSSLECIILHGFDNAQSINNMQTRKGHGGRGKMGYETGEECKQQKRPRSTYVHNLNERIRRKKLTEKLATLQEMIPNSVKRDQASTIDDAIKYIKALQCQVQMMSSEASHTLFHSPAPQLGQQGIQIPSLAPFPPQVCLGMSTLLSSVPYPVGLTNPWLFQTPGLATAHSIQNNAGQLLETIYANSIPCFGSQLSIGANGEA